MQRSEERKKKEFAEVVALYKKAAASQLQEEARLGGRRVVTVRLPDLPAEKAADTPKA